MVDGAPEIVRLAVDLYEDLIQMPLILAKAAHPGDALFADLGGESRTESIPPVADCFVADVDPAFVK